jgi:predicted Holliday junction resolvase-like endonuclease
MEKLFVVVDEMQGILGICPCCGEIFRLTEARLKFPEMQPRTSDYTDYLRAVAAFSHSEKEILAAEMRLEMLEEKHITALDKAKEIARDKGRKKAKNILKKIDPVFSGNDIDPQDVKVLFDPVEFVVFDKLNTQEELKKVEFVNHSPTNKREENIERSLLKIIRNGNYEFSILHVDRIGNIQ